jgi:tetratricopeptide (TPR) repeat protein
VVTVLPETDIRQPGRWRAACLISLLLTGAVIQCRATEQPSAGNRGCTAAKPLQLLNATSPAAADPEDYYKRALELVSARREADAQRAFQFAVDLKPEEDKYVRALALFYINRERYDEALEVIGRHVNLCGATALGYELEAELLFKKRMFDSAFKAASLSLELFSAAARPHELLGLIFVAKRQNGAATVELGKAVALDPENPQMRYFYGRLLYNAQRFQDASEQLLACLRIQPGFPRALENLGLTYEKLGDTNAAIESYQSAIAQEKARPESRNVEPYACLAALLAKLQRQDEALEILRRALAISPNSFRANFELGRLLMGVEKYSDAEQPLLAAAQLAPTFSRTYFLLGKLRQKQNRHSEAEVFWAKFSDLDRIPENREIPLTDR